MGADYPSPPSQQADTDNNKNYLLCPPAFDDESDYLALIEAMKHYSERLIECSTQLQRNIPFPIVFMLNLLMRYPSNIMADDCAKSFKFKRYLAKYIEHYFNQHYTPHQIPLLYAIICENRSDGLAKLGFDHNVRHYKTSISEGVKYHEMAVKYFKMYVCKEEGSRGQLNENVRVLPEVFMNVLEDMDSTMLYLKTLNHLTAGSNENAGALKKRHFVQNSRFLMSQSFQCFVVNHKTYSIYHRDNDDSCRSGLMFVCEMTKRMIQHDNPSTAKTTRKYQKRYKKLLKIALKSWGKYFGCHGEKYGLYLVYLGYYYAIFCTKRNRLEISRKYLHKGISVIHEYNKYTKTLMDIYIFVIWIEKALGNFDECMNLIKISMDFNRHYNLSAELNEDKEELKEVKRMDKWNHLQKKKYQKVYWEQQLQNRKYATSIHPIYNSESLSLWIYYFKTDDWYQVMKNICFLKECNFDECRAKNVQLYKCSKCKSVYYCCRNHQKMDWKIKHKMQCTRFAERHPCFTLKNNINRWEPSTDKPFCLIDVTT